MYSIVPRLPRDSSWTALKAKGLSYHRSEKSSSMIGSKTLQRVYIHFANELGEKVAYGPRTVLEYFLLECVLKHCYQEGIDTTTQNIMTIFNATVEVSMAVKDDLLLAQKNNDAVEKFL